MSNTLGKVVHGVMVGGFFMLIFSKIRSILLILVVTVIFLTIWNISFGEKRELEHGWSNGVTEAQKVRMIAEFPEASPEQMSEILRLEAKVEQLEQARRQP